MSQDPDQITIYIDGTRTTTNLITQRLRLRQIARNEGLITSFVTGINKIIADTISARILALSSDQQEAQLLANSLKILNQLRTQATKEFTQTFAKYNRNYEWRNPTDPPNRWNTVNLWNLTRNFPTANQQELIKMGLTVNMVAREYKKRNNTNQRGNQLLGTTASSSRLTTSLNINLLLSLINGRKGNHLKHLKSLPNSNELLGFVTKMMDDGSDDEPPPIDS